MTTRACGTCSLCCKVLAIVPEALLPGELDIVKPSGRWCTHCHPGKGCSVYETRPETCRSFSCDWLSGGVPDHWKPSTCRMVSHTVASQISQQPIRVTHCIVVDRDYQNVWREEPFFSDILRWSQWGLNNTPPIYTKVAAGQREWLILPNQQVESGGRPFSLIRTGEATWEVTFV